MDAFNMVTVDKDGPQTVCHQVSATADYLDVMGHVNHARYLDLFENARWQFITENNFGPEQCRQLQIGPIILEAHIFYRSEIVESDQLSVYTQKGEIYRNKIMDFHQQMIKNDSAVAAELGLRMALMDLKTRKIINFTPEWIEATSK